MARLLVITHPAGGDAGVFAEAAIAAGHELEPWSPAAGAGPPRDLGAYAGLVVLGGEQNVCELERFPYLAGEIELIARWQRDGRPLLGVCLGAQLLAQATGGTVQRLAAPEIGWTELTLTAAGIDDPVLGPRPTTTLAYQWHSYAVTLPPAATALASNPACVQAFRIGNSWGVQFHPEVTPATVESWTASWREDTDAVAIGFDPDRARAQDRDALPAWMAYGQTLFSRFCDQLG